MQDNRAGVVIEGTKDALGSVSEARGANESTGELGGTNESIEGLDNVVNEAIRGLGATNEAIRGLRGNNEGISGLGGTNEDLCSVSEVIGGLIREAIEKVSKLDDQGRLSKVIDAVGRLDRGTGDQDGIMEVGGIKDKGLGTLMTVKDQNVRLVRCDNKAQDVNSAIGEPDWIGRRLSLNQKENSSIIEGDVSVRRISITEDFYGEKVIGICEKEDRNDADDYDIDGGIVLNKEEVRQDGIDLRSNNLDLCSLDDYNNKNTVDFKVESFGIDHLDDSCRNISNSGLSSDFSDLKEGIGENLIPNREIMGFSFLGDKKLQFISSLADKRSGKVDVENRDFILNGDTSQKEYQLENKVDFKANVVQKVINSEILLGIENSILNKSSLVSKCNDISSDREYNLSVEEVDSVGVENDKNIIQEKLKHNTIWFIDEIINNSNLDDDSKLKNYEAEIKTPRNKNIHRSYIKEKEDLHYRYFQEGERFWNGEQTAAFDREEMIAILRVTTDHVFNVTENGPLITEETEKVSVNEVVTDSSNVVLVENFCEKIADLVVNLKDCSIKNEKKVKETQVYYTPPKAKLKDDRIAQLNINKFDNETQTISSPLPKTKKTFEEEPNKIDKIMNNSKNIVKNVKNSSDQNEDSLTEVLVDNTKEKYLPSNTKIFQRNTSKAESDLKTDKIFDDFNKLQKQTSNGSKHKRNNHYYNNPESYKTYYNKPHTSKSYNEYCKNSSKYQTTDRPISNYAKLTYQRNDKKLSTGNTSYGRYKYSEERRDSFEEPTPSKYSSYYTDRRYDRGIQKSEREERFEMRAISQYNTKSEEERHQTFTMPGYARFEKDPHRFVTDLQNTHSYERHHRFERDSHRFVTDLQNTHGYEKHHRFERDSYRFETYRKETQFKKFNSPKSYNTNSKNYAQRFDRNTKNINTDTQINTHAETFDTNAQTFEPKNQDLNKENFSSNVKLEGTVEFDDDVSIRSAVLHRKLENKETT